MRTKKVTKAILSHLVEAGAIMLNAFLPPNYPEAQLTRMLLGMDQKHHISQATAKHTLSSMLSQLKKQGLVVRTGPKNKSVWSITTKGRYALKHAIANYKLHYDLPPEDGVIRLVTFDIPERERHKRDWIRSELVTCGFTAIQKSVYLGKRPLPEEVIARITALNLTHRIHIIGIEKSGTLSLKS